MFVSRNLSLKANLLANCKTIINSIICFKVSIFSVLVYLKKGNAFWFIPLLLEYVIQKLVEGLQALKDKLSKILRPNPHFYWRKKELAKVRSLHSKSESPKDFINQLWILSF